MKTILVLISSVTLAGTLSACGVTYEERQTAYAPRHEVYRTYNDGYVPAYTPQRTYSSQWDYYRHYNGING